MKQILLTLLLLTTSCAIEKKNGANDDVYKIGVVSVVGNSVDSIAVNHERFSNTMYNSNVPSLEVDEQIENKIIDELATRTTYKVDRIPADRSLAQDTDISTHINRLVDLGKANDVDLVIAVLPFAGEDGETSGTVIKQGGSVTLESNFVVEFIHPKTPSNYLRINTATIKLPDRNSQANERVLSGENLLANVRLKPAADFTDGEQAALKTEIGNSLDYLIPAMLKQAGLVSD